MGQTTLHNTHSCSSTSILFECVRTRVSHASSFGEGARFVMICAYMYISKPQLCIRLFSRTFVWLLLLAGVKRGAPTNAMWLMAALA